MRVYVFAALFAVALAAQALHGGCDYPDAPHDTSWAAPRDRVAYAQCWAMIVCGVRAPNTATLDRCTDHWTREGGLYDLILAAGPNGPEAGLLRESCVTRLSTEEAFTPEVCGYYQQIGEPRAPECR